MDFRIADTFTDSLARLTGDEQKLVKTTAFDLQTNPSQPGLQFHRLDRARDARFWSVRASADLRIIVHRTDGSLLLCYAGHHDEAYSWGERRRLETHPKTGAAQLVEIRETVREIEVPKYVEVERPKPALFAHLPMSELLSYGVPQEWIEEVQTATEETILAIAGHLPAEAAEALLDLATGSKPKTPAIIDTQVDPFHHPDAQRRFRVMSNVEELERALDYPWDKWTVFLHPSQRQIASRDYNGPARVAGSAGTGKTIVALHRAVGLARKHPDARILLTTFSDTLSASLRAKLRRLIGNEPRLAERIDVDAIDNVALRLYEGNLGKRARLATKDDADRAIAEAAASISGHKFTARFLRTEWEQVVDAWHLRSWESYRDVPRLGRKTRLPEAQRVVLWSIFSAVWSSLDSQNLLTPSALFTTLAGSLRHSPYDFAVVDEAQDLSVSQLRFLAALGASRPDALFFAGDLGQRIFQTPFSWKALGIDIRGRSTTLKINYRTSHQIRRQADRLLASAVTDVDGNTEERKGTTSVFNGPPPQIEMCDSPESETATVAAWLKALAAKGVAPSEIGLFVRSEAELPRAQAAAKQAGLPARLLDGKTDTGSAHASIGTMHMAKGLEYRAVVVLACDDEVIPSQARIETVGDEADLEEVYSTERHLLYVACTRARDHLLVTGATPASEFLDDLR